MCGSPTEETIVDAGNCEIVEPAGYECWSGLSSRMEAKPIMVFVSVLPPPLIVILLPLVNPASEATVTEVAPAATGSLRSVVMTGVGDGDDVGLELGETVGVAVGAAVGDDVGLELGEAVGVAVGLEVGDDVGLELGEAVGAAVGAVVGAAVGQA